MKNKKKKSRKCHIKDYAKSMGIGGNSKESLFYKDWI